MKNFKAAYVSVIIIFIVLSSIAFYAGLNYMDNSVEIPESEENMSVASVYTKHAPQTPPPQAITPTKSSYEEERISLDTKIIYEYYYESDGQIEVYEEWPKFFLLDMTAVELQAAHLNWELVSFSKDEVILRKSISAKDGNSYILGVQDGYLAVFYADENNRPGMLKEITKTPIASLPESEQKRLLDGIIAKDDTALINLLEDYGS